jgi:hypothetical protein
VPNLSGQGAVTNRGVRAHPLPPWLSPIFDALLCVWQLYARLGKPFITQGTISPRGFL